MTVALCVVSALAGALIGWLARRVRQRVITAEPATPTRMTVAELNRAVIRDSPTGLVVVDRFRDVIACNARAEEFTGAVPLLIVLFFAVSAETQAEVWPWEDYTLAESRVETSLPETDLFAGIDPTTTPRK